MSYRNEKDIDAMVTKAVDAKMAKALEDMDYSQKIIDRIVKRTQLGTGVDPDTSNSQKLKPLSANYKEQRQGKANWYTAKSGAKIKVTENVKKPKLASTTTPARSNLTATGQLLKSLKVIKTKIRGGMRYLITVKDNRGPDMYGNASKIGNKTLIGYLAAQGRKFLGLTKSQQNEMRREIRQIIIRFIK